jgi:hypothetical protein
MIPNISRTPPSSVRRKLRQEVYFGCPVQGCGSPYLSWHHFDPPWTEKKHHNVNGMIALCLQHHKEADGGAFTKQQLRQMKSSPYLKRVGGLPAGRFNWKREQLLVVAGGNYYLEAESILRVNDHRIVWLSKDKEGCEQLNLDIRRADGSKLVSMLHNDWEIHTSIDDLECPPSGNSLSLRLKGEGVSLDLNFSLVNKARLRAQIDSISKRQCDLFSRVQLRATPQETTISYPVLPGTPSAPELAYRAACDRKEEDIALCTVRARLRWPEEVCITELYIKTNRGDQFGGNFFARCDCGIKDGSPSF